CSSPCGTTDPSVPGAAMNHVRQLVVLLALAPLTLVSQGVSVGGFETHGSVGMSRADYRSLGVALSSLLAESLGARGSTQVVPLSAGAGSSGRIDLGAARTAASEAGAKVLVVGSLLDQYGDIQVEARVIDAATGTPIAVVKGDPAFDQREQLAEAIAVLANQLTSQASVGGSPMPAGAGVPVSALVSYGRGIEAESAGD